MFLWHIDFLSRKSIIYLGMFEGLSTSSSLLYMFFTYYEGRAIFFGAQCMLQSAVLNKELSFSCPFLGNNFGK